MVAAASVESEVSLSKLKEFIPEKRPNYIKVVDITIHVEISFTDSQFLISQAIRKWNKGLTESHNDLLALASFTAAAEKANQIMAAGSTMSNPLSRLCDTYCQEKMLSPMCLPRWPQAGRKCRGFSPML